ncbi:probable protein phosphatase 2C 2 [Zingiber officinale]|uniref:probable protein phosphatase 2C 2 n=1 Tax=Zingiber officinale TaxID=94328 RepID=UPI001C4CEB3D|nr:probable protein phosphatase 2C 2 [Zingiber officinale]
MLVEAEVAPSNFPVPGVQCRCGSGVVQEVAEVSSAAADATSTLGNPSPEVRLDDGGADGADADLAVSDMGTRSSLVAVDPIRSYQFVPNLRSGSFANVGPRRYMEDEYIRIDDLSENLGSMLRCPTPSAFYGIFDGHGGPDASAYIKRHAIRILFEDAGFPHADEPDEDFMKSVENSIKSAFQLADLALADECTISSSSGTTALIALVFGRLLMVANAGDCRAVLCRKGEAVEMSQDHRPTNAVERQRIEASGGYIDGGYLNGVLSLTRALGDWDIKEPRGSPSPLIAEPEFRHALLSEDDEFLIIGCDGIWDVMSNQHAVNIVSKGLRRHDNPELCARELVSEALRLKTFDNLTVIVVCFSDEYSMPQGDQPQLCKFRCCKSLSIDALCNLKNWLGKNGRS